MVGTDVWGGLVGHGDIPAASGPFDVDVGVLMAGGHCVDICQWG